MIDEIELDTLNKIGPQQCDQRSELKVAHFVKKLQKLALFQTPWGKYNKKIFSLKFCYVVKFLKARHS